MIFYIEASKRLVSVALPGDYGSGADRASATRLPRVVDADQSVYRREHAQEVYDKQRRSGTGRIGQVYRREIPTRIPRRQLLCKCFERFQREIEGVNDRLEPF